MIKLQHQETGKFINPGDVLKTFRGESVTVTGWPTDGHNRVYVRTASGQAIEYFPTVINCVLVDV